MFENLHEASHLEKSIWTNIILVMHVLEMVWQPLCDVQPLLRQYIWGGCHLDKQYQCGLSSYQFPAQFCLNLTIWCMQIKGQIENTTVQNLQVLQQPGSEFGPNSVRFWYSQYSLQSQRTSRTIWVWNFSIFLEETLVSQITHVPDYSHGPTIWNSPSARTTFGKQCTPGDV